MKSQKLACWTMFLVFVALGVASGWFVYRRASTTTAAIVGGFVGAIVLWLPIGFLSAIPGRLRDWWLILRARMGSTPGDGSRAAVIGTLRAAGDVRTPFSRERCALYEYEIHGVSTSGGETSTSKAYSGFAMAPLSIEHGVERTRLLAKPQILLKPNNAGGRMVEDNAMAYLQATEFSDAPSTFAEPGEVTRADYRHKGAEPNLATSRFVEKILPADVSACAIGTYDASRNALTEPIRLFLGETQAINAAWRVVNSMIAAVIFGAIAVTVVAIFCANFPIDAAEFTHPQRTFSWPEVELERAVDKHVRAPLSQAGMLGTPGTYVRDVCEGCASGTLEINGRVIELRSAVAVDPDSVRLCASPGDADGLTLVGSERLVLTVAGKSADVPPSWLQPGDVATFLESANVRHGRVTIVAPDRSIRCRVTFKVRLPYRAASSP